MWASFRHLTVASPCRVCLAEVYQDKALVGEFMNRKCNYEDPKVGPARWSDSARPGDWDCWVPVWPTRSPRRLCRPCRHRLPPSSPGKPTGQGFGRGLHLIWRHHGF